MRSFERRISDARPPRLAYLLTDSRRDVADRPIKPQGAKRDMNRLLWGAAAAVLFFAVPAFAADQREVLEALGKCAALTEDKARLACYDALAPQAKEALSTPPAVALSPPSRPRRSNSAATSFLRRRRPLRAQNPPSLR